MREEAVQAIWSCLVLFEISRKIGRKQTQLDHVKNVTEKSKATLPRYTVFVKISEPGIHLYMWFS
jgi:hypothetical protein